MAHRLTFPANAGVPLALKLVVEDEGWLYALDPTQQDEDHRDDAPDGDPVESRLQLLAVDATPLDRLDRSTEDSLWFEAVVQDPLGRDIEIRAREVVCSARNHQHFGGVAIDLYEVEGDVNQSASWSLKPLDCWATFEVTVDGSLTDAGVLGRVELTEDPAAPKVYTLRLTMHPKTGHTSGAIQAQPFQAAEALGMAGWILEWEDVVYHQAPVITARVETGDSLDKIARDMFIDKETILRANPRLIHRDAVTPGERIRVPFLLGGATQATRRIFPSAALSWKEIIRGWTTLN